MSAKVNVDGVDITLEFDRYFNIIASYDCPNCKTPNRVQLSDAEKDDKIPCSSCGIYKLFIGDTGFADAKKAILDFQRSLKGFGK